MASFTTSSPTVTVSAPGKMLLAGGYLVLERPNAGWVVAANKRFYTTIQAAPASSKNLIRVFSPQFHSKWFYEYDPTNSNVQPAVSNTSINPFVEKTLRVCLLYLLDAETRQCHESLSLDITIQADNDFYSVLPHLPPNQPRTPGVVATLGKFLKCPTREDGTAIVNKTGLGSSAALTTSLVGGLVHYFGSPSKKKEAEDSTTVIHNLAQICHCHAQGKVGSGFDVSAACFGTHVYRRFPKCLLPDLLGQLDHEESIGGMTNSRTTLLALAQDPWEEDMVQPLPLPSGKLQVLLADVQGGSESPSMARTVLKWKQSRLTAGQIPHWDDLKRLNGKVVELMESILADDSKIDYEGLSSQPASQWPTSSPLFQLQTTFSEIRQNLRSMGNEADVPIEPVPQTKLCDATAQLPGVVTCLVPGAGGFDAVVCLYIDRPSVLEAIGNLWASWESPMICPLNVRASQNGLRVETDFETPSIPVS
jgi:phosphomevalonate kinase